MFASHLGLINVLLLGSVVRAFGLESLRMGISRTRNQRVLLKPCVYSTTSCYSCELRNRGRFKGREPSSSSAKRVKG